MPESRVHSRHALARVSCTTSGKSLTILLPFTLIVF